MDGVLGVCRGYSKSSMKIQKQAASNSNKIRSRKSSSSKDIKVVYISNPMKVNTSASEFRALVQQLTGRHSDTARLMEITDNSSSTTTSDNSKETVFGSDADEDVHHRHPHQQQQQQQYLMKATNFDHYNYINHNSSAFYDIKSPNYINTTASTTSQPLFHHDHQLLDDVDDFFVSNNSYIDSVVL